MNGVQLREDFEACIYACIQGLCVKVLCDTTEEHVSMGSSILVFRLEAAVWLRVDRAAGEGMSSNKD